jgi:UDP-sugar pyrophosphorylase
MESQSMLSDSKFIDMLHSIGQGHLFEGWDDAEENVRQQFLEELRIMNDSYPGGLTAYVENARTLLALSKEGANPFEGCTPAQPDTVDLTAFDQTYRECEEVGLAHMDRLAVVLVAGGLGERLGYPGIKLDIPVEVLESTSYLAYYASVLLAMQARTGKSVPFVIMVSRDTHAGTMAALEKHDYFGLARDSVYIVKQELVPALMDNDARIALAAPCTVAAKPHGHGDIHMLLHSSGIAQKLREQGIEYLSFIQDTNGQVFNALFAALGASVIHKYDFNSVGVNRVPGEAVGALCKLEYANGQSTTLNVEYNLLDPLLRATVSPEGDIANEKGFSLFPGNINVLLIALQPYCEILEKTQGIIAEFVNPKYADESRNSFKKPTRLETMMQDLPKLFTDAQRVGVTIFDRIWCFSADKNNVVDAAAKAKAGAPPESAATAESDFFWAHRQKLLHAGMSVDEAEVIEVLGIPLTPGPRVLLHPSFALGMSEVDARIEGGSIAGDATLILEGDITLKNVEITSGSALVIKACPGAQVVVDSLRVDNRGYEQVMLCEEELASDSCPAYLKIRGYHMREVEVECHIFDAPGEYTL